MSFVTGLDDRTDDTPATAVPSAFLITLAPEDDDQDEVATIHIDKTTLAEGERRRRLAPPPAPPRRAWVDVTVPDSTVGAAQRRALGKRREEVPSAPLGPLSPTSLGAMLFGAAMLGVLTYFVLR